MTIQRLVIRDWLPAPLTNGPRGHWSAHQKKLRDAQVMVWASAKQDGLQPVEGRARVTFVLVFPNHRRRDLDGLYARVKGCLDGLVKGKWIADDNTQAIELVVRDEVRPGIKQLEITLEPA